MLITIFKSKTKLFIVSLVSLLLVSVISDYLSQAMLSLDDSILAITFEAISYIAYTLLVLLILSRLWTLLVKVGRTLLSLSETEQIDVTAKETITNLTQTLAEIEQDASNASMLVYDAQTYTSRLVAIVKALSLKAENLRSEADVLQEAIEAIDNQNPIAIAKAAGQISDTQIRDLMLCNVKNQQYWYDVSRLIAAQLGTLIQWSQSYDRFASNLLTEISGAKAKISGLTGTLELASTTRPLLQVQENLGKAESYLLIDDNRTLPTISSKNGQVLSLIGQENK